MGADMDVEITYSDIDGLLILKSKSAKWPASSNTYILTSGNKSVIIDPGCGFSQRAKLIEKILEKKNSHSSVVLLTHAHPDHMGAARFLKAESFLAHEIEVKYARNPELLSESFNIPFIKSRYVRYVKFDLLKYFEKLCPIYGVKALPFPEEINFGDYRIQPILTPGHSPGHTSFYIPDESLVFSGDLLGEIMAWYSPASGGVEAYAESLKRLEKLKAETIMPSHGDPATSSRIEKEKEILEQRERIILEEVEKGVNSREELLKTLFGDKWNFLTNLLILESHLIKLEKEGKISEIS